MNVVFSNGKDEWTAFIVPDANVTAKRSKPLRYLSDLCSDVGHDI